MKVRFGADRRPASQRKQAVAPGAVKRAAGLDAVKDDNFADRRWFQLFRDPCLFFD
jgi:hypothetical protein